MFKREQAPYLFTVAIAAIGWLVTRAVDETTKSPLLAYSICDRIEHNERFFTVRLHNISTSTAFRQIYLALTNLDGTKSRFTWAAPEYEAPIHPSKLTKATPQWDTTWAGCLFSELQPRTSVLFKTKIDGRGTPQVRFDSTNDTVRLVKSGVLTIAVEYESEILLALAGVLTVLLVIYAIYLGKAA
jgi:hypothetical protein